MSATGLPAGWSAAMLEDAVDILDSMRVPVNAREREGRSGDVPYYGATGRVGWIDSYLFDDELVLLGEDGAPFLDPTKPKAYLIAGRSWVNNHAHVLRAREGISNRFLLYQLNQVDYRDFVSGTTRLKLPQGPMRDIPLVIAPTSEQRRIVATIEEHLSALGAAVAALERVRADLKRYRASVVEEAVAEGDRTGWRWVAMRDLVEDGPQNGSYLPKSAYGAGTPIVRIDDYQDWWSRASTELRRVSADEPTVATYLLRVSDLVITESTVPATSANRLLSRSGTCRRFSSPT